MTKTIRVLLLVPYTMAALFWEGFRVIWRIWFKMRLKLLPWPFTGSEFALVLCIWGRPTLDTAMRRFEKVFENDCEDEFWVNYPIILNQKTWFLQVLLWACVAEVLRLIWFLWNRTYALWPRKHSADALSFQRLLANMPSLKYLDYDLRSLRDPKSRRVRMVKNYAEDYARNYEVYFFMHGRPAVNRLIVEQFWRTLWKQYHENGGRGKIPELDESVLKRLEG